LMKDGQLRHDLTAAPSSYADRFESALENGQDTVAALAAQGIVQILEKWWPQTLSTVYSERHCCKPPAFLIFLTGPVSIPDNAYLEPVRSAVEAFKEALGSGDIGGAIRALCPTGILAGKKVPQAERRVLDEPSPNWRGDAVGVPSSASEAGALEWGS
jgi:hypothetical protein